MAKFIKMQSNTLSVKNKNIQLYVSATWPAIASFGRRHCYAAIFGSRKGIFSKKNNK
jgi:hypothetical protein